MAKYLYRNVWEPEEIRTIIMGTLVVSICFLLELLFLFPELGIEKSFLAFLFWELDLGGLGIFTPLLTIFHLIVWGIMFFSTLMVYTMIREYTGGRTGLLEIAGITLFFAVFCLIMFDEWFALFFLGVAALLLAYLYLSLAER
ncbi:MAG: hypothetical protein JSV04_13160 [Candidatus Heimdallarchaeota archaeon]|nr:MAG: hypothetical protein JSV04_13160 [Candidatus Heimdallarchaeota archaeon]